MYVIQSYVFVKYFIFIDLWNVMILYKAMYSSVLYVWMDDISYIYSLKFQNMNFLVSM